MDYEPDPEEAECRECGAVFNLSVQNYYDNRCPECMKEDEPERTWQTCSKCNEPIPPEERAYMEVRGAARDPSTVKIPVHEDCKEPASRGFGGP